MTALITLILQVLAQVVPAVIKEYNKQKQIDKDNIKIRLAVVGRREKVRELSIVQVIKLGIKK